MLALIMRRTRRRLRDAVEFAEGVHRSRATVSTEPRQPPRRRAPRLPSRVRDVLAWFDEAVPLSRHTGNPLSHVPRRRRLIPDDGTVLRFHPRCPYGDGHYPCLLALWRDIASDSPRAIHRRPLSPRTTSSAPLESPRSTTGAAIKLCPHDAVAMAGTGRSPRALRQHFPAAAVRFRSAWAAVMQTLRAFPVLSSVQTLTILVDQ